MLKVAWTSALLLATALPVQEVDSTPFAWSAKRALTWSDFIAKPEPGSKAGALTVYHLTYQEDCALDKYSFTVVSVFQPLKSWVKPSVIASPDARRRVLAHEQGHFDLSEVSARKLRKALLQLQYPCGMTNVERRAVVQKHLRDDIETQRRYDDATGQGIDEAEQIRLILEIGRELLSLAEFAANPGGLKASDYQSTTSVVGGL